MLIGQLLDSAAVPLLLRLLHFPHGLGRLMRRAVRASRSQCPKAFPRPTPVVWRPSEPRSESANHLPLRSVRTPPASHPSGAIPCSSVVRLSTRGAFDPGRPGRVPSLARVSQPERSTSNSIMGLGWVCGFEHPPPSQPNRVMTASSAALKLSPVRCIVVLRRRGDGRDEVRNQRWAPAGRKSTALWNPPS